MIKKHLPLILLAVMAFAASCTPDTPSYVDTVVGKYYTIGKNYDKNDVLFYQDTGFLWIRKIGEANDRILQDPGSDTYLQDNDSNNVFKLLSKGIISFQNDSLFLLYKRGSLGRTEYRGKKVD